MRTWIMALWVTVAAVQAQPMQLLGVGTGTGVGGVVDAAVEARRTADTPGNTFRARLTEAWVVRVHAERRLDALQIPRARQLARDAAALSVQTDHPGLLGYVTDVVSGSMRQPLLRRPLAQLPPTRVRPETMIPLMPPDVLAEICTVTKDELNRVPKRLAALWVFTDRRILDHQDLARLEADYLSLERDLKQARAFLATRTFLPRRSKEFARFDAFSVDFTARLDSYEARLTREAQSRITVDDLTFEQAAQNAWDANPHLLPEVGDHATRMRRVKELLPADIAEALQREIETERRQAAD